MGNCKGCNCIKESNESDQIVFPFFKNLTYFSDENIFNYNKNFLSKAQTLEKNTIDQIRLTNTEKRIFENLVRNSHLSRDKPEITLKEESKIAISNSLFNEKNHFDSHRCSGMCR